MYQVSAEFLKNTLEFYDFCRAHGIDLGERGVLFVFGVCRVVEATAICPLNL